MSSRRDVEGTGRHLEKLGNYLCWLALDILTQTTVSLENGTSIEKSPPLDWPVSMSLFSLINDSHGRADMIVEVPSYKKVGRARHGGQDNKQCTSIVSG